MNPDRIDRILVTSTWHTFPVDTECCGGDIYDPGCPGRLALDRIGDRWTVLIVGILESGTHRFSQLRDAVGGITPKVLTQTLRAMERDGLVTRTVYAEVPPRVEYCLTDLGRSLAVPIAAIRTWAIDNMANFTEAPSS
ncbi:helix-turn-helix transcriptional regulator [Microlunatus elymi]|uniref:Helix-turn-helix transcriptional regulator n=2 Tax=Microlunatus elymi TaxID=2596828 RepID=A0A516Q673_9ACTN|nr:helix-turn-helix transcriptional regulator [Microlunatus elymi]